LCSSVGSVRAVGFGLLAREGWGEGGGRGGGGGREEGLCLEVRAESGKHKRNRLKMKTMMRKRTSQGSSIAKHASAVCMQAPLKGVWGSAVSQLSDHASTHNIPNDPS
jgi:hypothetical protein